MEYRHPRSAPQFCRVCVPASSIRLDGLTCAAWAPSVGDWTLENAMLPMMHLSLSNPGEARQLLTACRQPTQP